MTSVQSLRFIVGRFVAALGDQFLMFAAPLIVYKTTGSVAKSGIAFAVEWLPRVLTLPVAGFLADRFNHRTLYLVADGARVVICFISFLFLHFQVFDPFLVIMLLMGLIAIFNSLAFITVEATIPRLFLPTDLPKAQSALQASDQLSQIAGPSLAAASLLLFSHDMLVALPAFGFCLSGFNILFIGPLLRSSEDKTPVSLAQFMSTLRFGMQTLMSRQELLMLSFLAGIVNFVMGMTLAQAVPLIVGTFQKSEQFLGTTTTIAALLSILTFTQIPRLAQKLPLTTLGTQSLLGLIAAGLLLSRAPHVYIFVAGYSLLMTSCAVFNVFMRTWRARIIPKEHLGKVIGLLVLVNNSTLPLSGAFVAGFATNIGPQNMILVASLALVLATLIYLYWLRIYQTQTRAA